MARFKVRIARIEPQRDQFLIGDKILQDVEFFTSTHRATDVHAFKRFVVHCQLVWAEAEHSFKLIFNARSHVVRVAAKNLPVGANMIGQALVETLSRFRDIPNPPIIVDHDGFFEFALEDAVWACAVLHDLREHGGFDGEARWRAPDAPFRRW